MKKLFLPSLFLLMLYSCSTPTTPSTTTSTGSCIGPQPKFQFKANGTLYVCDAVFDNRFGWVGNYTPYRNFGLLPSLHYASGSTPHYELSGGISTSSSSTDETFINLFLQTATLPSTSVPYNETNVPSDCIFNFDNNSYSTSTHTITFTRIDGRTADGSFSGSVKTSSTPSNTVTITDGSFLNIPVFSN